MTRVIAGAVKETLRAHGAIDPNSVGKRAAAELWAKRNADAHSNLAEWVKHLRRDLEMTQEELALALGTSQVTVSRWESGHSAPSPRFKARLSEMARVPFGEALEVVSEAGKVFALDQSVKAENEVLKSLYFDKSRQLDDLRIQLEKIQGSNSVLASLGTEPRAHWTSRDFLARGSIDWTSRHISIFGDTDIVPVPFEYKAIQDNWDGLKTLIGNIDLSTHETRSLRRFLVPKPGGGYRVATQLDPIDTIIYDALVVEVAENVEAIRAPRDSKISCAYRIEIDPIGRLFSDTNRSWQDYCDASADLAGDPKCHYVVTADIADFYNQVGHQRVRNALELSGVRSTRAHNIERFLNQIAGGQTRGLPVGPVGSIVLAEACLADVDAFLTRNGYKHTRYVDDFRLFCPDQSHANRAIHDLCDYLYSVHRLSLQASKAQFWRADAFLQRVARTTNADSQEQKLAIVLQFLEDARNTIDYSDFDDVVYIRKMLRRSPYPIEDYLDELFKQTISRASPSLARTRLILRLARTLCTEALLTRVLNNLQKLKFVSREIVMYLESVVNHENVEKITDSVFWLLEGSSVRTLPYVREWYTNFAVEHLTPDTVRLATIAKTTGLRSLAILGRRMHQVEWLRSEKDTWEVKEPWARRALLWASSIFSANERGNWFDKIGAASDILERAIIQMLR